MRQSTLPGGSTTSPSAGASLTGSLSAGNWQGVIGMLTGGSGAISGASSGKTKTNPLKKSLDTRGGVVKERDGYEVFFGVTEGQAKTKVPDRDGFDIFYGIKNDERGTPDTSTAKDDDAQLRARISQVALPRRERRLTAPPQVGGHASKHSADARSPRSAATAAVAKAKPSAPKSKRVSQPVVPESVPTFSLATPAPSFAPNLVASSHDEPPSNVQLYSMATPCSSFAPPAVRL